MKQCKLDQGNLPSASIGYPYANMRLQHKSQNAAQQRETPTHWHMQQLELCLSLFLQLHAQTKISHGKPFHLFQRPARERGQPGSSFLTSTTKTTSRFLCANFPDANFRANRIFRLCIGVWSHPAVCSINWHPSSVCFSSLNMKGTRILMYPMSIFTSSCGNVSLVSAEVQHFISWHFYRKLTPHQTCSLFRQPDLALQLLRAKLLADVLIEVHCVGLLALRGSDPRTVSSQTCCSRSPRVRSHGKL